MTLSYPKVKSRYRLPVATQEGSRFSFSDVIASAWSDSWDSIKVGSGDTLSQASGNGLLVAGTTANAETIQRFKLQFDAPLSLRAKVTLSQRIANNNFFIELVDVLGDVLPCVINSATSITVTLPADAPTFSNANVGQGINVGAITGAAGIPMRATIASVNERDLTLTVAGWPVSGSCTVSLFGWNFNRILYDGTTATNAKYDCGRKGWASGDTTATVATTASAHVAAIIHDENQSVLADATVNSTSFTQRAQRTENLPDAGVDLVLQIRSLNGTVAPASNTTLTIGFIAVEQWDSQVVNLGTGKPAGTANAITLVPNQAFNLAQANGNALSTGNGTAGTGAPRVCVASDNTAFPISSISTSVTPGTGATNLGKARDSAVGATDTVVGLGMVRRDIPVTATPAAGDYDVPLISAKGAQWVAQQGAPTTTHLVSAASTNATVVKASPGILHDIEANNLNAAARYLKIYDKATAPTVGTDTPKRVIPLQAGTTGASIQRVLDIECTAGISFALTTGIANSDTGAVAANEHVVGTSFF